MSGHDFLSLSDWRRIRRYAVPKRMIDECAAARERGDWQAACAAGEVDVAFDERTLRAKVGQEQAERLAGQLAGFAPDLLRWHLPRALGGSTALATDATYLLTPERGKLAEDTAALLVRAPKSVLGSQRLTLDVGTAADQPRDLVRLAPYRWDARAAGLREAVGGSAARLPRFTPGGEPLPQEAWGAADDLPSWAERALASMRTTEAWVAAGFQVDTDRDPLTLSEPVDPMLVAREVRRLAAQFGLRTWLLRLNWSTDLRIEVAAADEPLVVTVLGRSSRWDDAVKAIPHIPAATVRPSPDLDLLWHRRMAPVDLHPLVLAAFFPSGLPLPPAPEAEPREPVRVRCRGDWHEITHHHGTVTTPAHTEAEAQRELMMRAFGGPISGCFAAAQAWRGAPGRMPKRLRAARQDLWERMFHGGTRTVVELLDAGLDPHIRDGRGRTLLHALRAFDHTVLLPRLLKAGLDVNTRDKEGSTPLYLAVVFVWPPDLIMALIDAGADPHAPNQDDVSVLDYIDDVLEYHEEGRSEEFRAAVEYLKARA